MSTILLVDNSELITEIVGEQLTDNPEFGGYKVIKATSFETALMHLDEGNFDFLITDYYLEQGNLGTELIQRCQKPALLLSFDEIAYKADAVGAGFINKQHGVLDRRIHDWILKQPIQRKHLN